MEIIELKNIINEQKDSIEEYNINLDQAEETISELKSRAVEFIQLEQYKENRMKNNKNGLGD